MTNALILRPEGFEGALRLADMMSRAKVGVPAHFHNQPGDCLMVIEQAMRWGMSPFAVAQCTSLIQGKLMFEGKLVAAALHTSGALKTRLDYIYTGTGPDRAVTVTATLAGEDKPREVTVRLADAKTNNGIWQKQPDQQLSYHGARVWARRYCPEVMLGVYAPEEMEQPAARDAEAIVVESVAVEAPSAPPTNGKRTPREIIAAFEGVKTAQDYYAIIDVEGERIARLRDLNPDTFALVDAARAAAADRMQDTPTPDDDFPGDKKEGGK